MQDWLSDAHALLNLGGAFIKLISEIIEYMGAIGIVSTAIDEVSGIAGALMQVALGDWDNLTNNLFWQHVKKAIYCNTPNSGIWDAGHWFAACMDVDLLYDPENPFYGVLETLMQMMSPTGANNTQKIYTSGGGDCAGIECENIDSWTHTFEFYNGEHGFHIMGWGSIPGEENMLQYPGEWSAGWGWIGGTLVDAENEENWCTYIVREAPGVTVTSGRITYSGTSGSGTLFEGSVSISVSNSLPSFTDYALTHTWNDPESGMHTLSGEAQNSSIAGNVIAGYISFDKRWCTQGVIVNLTLEGTSPGGVDPFEGE